MPRKKEGTPTETQKKKLSSGKKHSGDEARALLEEQELNTSNIRTEAIFLVENTNECFPAINRFAEICKRRKYGQVRTISHEDVLNFIATNKSVHGPSSHIMGPFFKAVKKELEEGPHTTTPVLALIIKCLMMKHRDEYEKEKLHQEALHQVLSDERIRLASPTKTGRKAGKGKGEKKDKKDKKKDNKKKSGNKKEGLEENFEAFCKDVNKEVEPSPTKQARSEFKRKKSTERFVPPEYGKDLYFVLIKFYDFNLVAELLKIGVQVRALVELGCFSEMPRARSMTEMSEDWEEDFKQFWKDFGFSEREETSAIYNNTCYLKYNLNLDEPDYMEHTYEDILRVLYNIEDLTRLHGEYNDSLKIHKLLPKLRLKLRNMKYYNALMHNIPNECCSVALILNNLLNEIYLRNMNERKTRLKQLGRLYVNLYWEYLNQKLEQRRKKEGKKSPNKARRSVRPTEIYFPELQLLRAKRRAQEKKEQKLSFNYNVRNLWKDYLNLYEECPPVSTEKSDIIRTKNIEISYGNPLDFVMSCFSKANIAKSTTLKLLTKSIPSEIFKDTRRNIKAVPYQMYEDDITTKFPGLTKEGIRSGIYACLFLEKFHNTVNQPTFYKPVVDEFSSTYMCADFKTFNQFYDRRPSFTFQKEDEPRWTKKTVRKEVKNKNDLFCKYSECYDSLAMIQMINNAMLDFKYYDWRYYDPHSILLLRFHSGKKNQKNVRKQSGEIIFRTPICFKDFCSHHMKTDQEWIMNNERNYWNSIMIHRNVVNVTVPCMIIPNSIKEKCLIKKIEEPKKESIESIHESIMEESESSGTISYYSPYDFESYRLDINNRIFKLKYHEVSFKSKGDITVEMNLHKWTGQIQECLIKVREGDSTINFHCLRSDCCIYKCSPFIFTVNLFNGTMMVFDKFKDMANVEGDISKFIMKTEKKARKKLIEENGRMDDLRETINKVVTAINNETSFYKIISSRLHKFQYIKPVKSKIKLSNKRLLQRLLHKWINLVNEKQKKNVNVCIPFVNGVKSKEILNYNWKATLPTGLLINTEHGTKSVYIRQKYIIKRKDLPLLEDETHRCFLNNGTILKFLKDGNVYAMYANRTTSLFEYGHFSSNDQSLQNSLYKLPDFKKKLYFRNRKLKNWVSQKHRFISRSECLRNKKDTYKFSKQIYKEEPDMIPLLKCKLVTSEGREMILQNKSCVHKIKQYYTFSFTDYLTKDIIQRREDGIAWTLNSKGYATTQFVDGTRITTWLSLVDKNYFVPKMEVHNIGSFRKVPPAPDSKYDWSCYVVVGINYKYEHPNYATVMYDYKTSPTVELPDDIRVSVPSDMEYEVKFRSNTMRTNRSSVTINKNICDICNCTECKVNVAPLFFKNTLGRDVFVQLRDCSKEMFQIEYSGVSRTFLKEQPNHLHKIVSQEPEERYFVLRPDLSGQELFHYIYPNRYIFCMHEIKASNNLTMSNTKIVASNWYELFYKTYAEQFMMLYSNPVLTTERQTENSREFRNLRGGTLNMHPVKNKPTYTIERRVYHVPKEIIIYWISIIQDYNRMRHKDVPVYLINYKESLEKELLKESPPPADEKLSHHEEVKKKRSLVKMCQFKDKIEEIRKSVQELEYSYFETKIGMAFLLINDCLEKAFQLSEAYKKPPRGHPIKTFTSYFDELARNTITHRKTETVTETKYISKDGEFIDEEGSVRRTHITNIENVLACDCDDAWSYAAVLQSERTNDTVSYVSEDTVRGQRAKVLELIGKAEG